MPRFQKLKPLLLSFSSVVDFKPGTTVLAEYGIARILSLALKAFHIDISNCRGNVKDGAVNLAPGS